MQEGEALCKSAEHGTRVGDACQVLAHRAPQALRVLRDQYREYVRGGFARRRAGDAGDVREAQKDYAPAHERQPQSVAFTRHEGSARGGGGLRYFEEAQHLLAKAQDCSEHYSGGAVARGMVLRHQPELAPQQGVLQQCAHAPLRQQYLVGRGPEALAPEGAARRPRLV